MEEGEEKKLTKKERREIAKQNKQKEARQKELSGKLKKLGIVLVGLGILGYFGFRGWRWLSTPIEIPQEVTEVASDDWIKGNPEASVTLIEYADFQCPACASYHPIVKQLTSEFPDDLRVVFRHFPLVNIHPNAMSAAKAAEAAGAQGKFWEMHDLLFEKQAQWSNERSPQGIFEEFAAELGLDIDQFKGDYNSSEVETSITTDIAVGNNTGINATPTFILNGVIIHAPRSVDDFRVLIENELEV